MFDDDVSKEIKGVLDLIYEKVESAYDDIEVNEEYKVEMKNMQRDQNQSSVQQLNAFGKPVLPETTEEGEKKPVKFLGTFGKKTKPAEAANKENLDDLCPEPVKKLKTDEATKN